MCVGLLSEHGISGLDAARSATVVYWAEGLQVHIEGQMRSTIIVYHDGTVQ